MKLSVFFLIFQLTMYDCFPTSVYMSLKNMGARIEYQEVLDLAVKSDVGYYADPTFVFSFGFSSNYSYIPNSATLLNTIASELVEKDYPILCKNLPKLGHCVTIYGLDEFTLYVIDPQLGYDEIEISTLPEYRYDIGWFLATFDAPTVGQLPQNMGK